MYVNDKDSNYFNTMLICNYDYIQILLNQLLCEDRKSILCLILT